MSVLIKVHAGAELSNGPAGPAQTQNFLLAFSRKKERDTAIQTYTRPEIIQIMGCRTMDDQVALVTSLSVADMCRERPDQLWRNEDGKQHTSREFLLRVEAEIVRIIEKGAHPACRSKGQSSGFLPGVCLG